MAGGSWSYTLPFLHTEGLKELVSITSLLLGSLDSEKSPGGKALVKRLNEGRPD